ELCGEDFEGLAADIDRALEVWEWTEQRRGFPYALAVLAIQAGVSYKGWYGSPWWRDVVELFIELLEDPASSAWKYDQQREAEPREVADRMLLKQILLEAPESL